MPTGYTAAVADGSVTDLKSFAMTIARGMGALVMMRDDPWDKPVPEAFEPSSYHADRMAEATKERDRLYALTIHDAKREAVAEHDAWVASRDAAEADHSARRQRYLDMIAQVEAWQNAPEGIKSFGLDQLRSGMDFDCAQPFKYYSVEPTTDGSEWLAAKIADANKAIERHAVEYAKECARTDGRNAWITQLRRSLEQPA